MSLMPYHLKGWVLHLHKYPITLWCIFNKIHRRPQTAFHMRLFVCLSLHLSHCFSRSTQGIPLWEEFLDGETVLSLALGNQALSREILFLFSSLLK